MQSLKQPSPLAKGFFETWRRSSVDDDFSNFPLASHPPFRYIWRRNRMLAKRKFILGSHAKKLTFLAASSSGMVDAVYTHEWRDES